MNSISFLGRLGRDGEFKMVGDTPLLSLNVANNVGFGDKKTTNWFNCNIWGKQAASLEQYMTKGKLFAITGELTLRKFERKDGTEGVSPEVRVDRIEFAGGKNEESETIAPPETFNEGVCEPNNKFSSIPARNEPSNKPGSAPAPNEVADEEIGSDIPF